MQRRRLLAALATLPVAGCLAGSPGRQTGTPTATTTPTDPTPIAVEPTATLTYNGETVLTHTETGYAHRAVGPYYLAVLATTAHADRFADRLTNREGRTFLSETDFESAIVIVLQDAAGQSMPDFAANEVTLRDGAVILDVEYPGKAATADITQDMLFVRVPHNDRSIEHATVTIGGMDDSHTTISTVGRYDRPTLTEPRDIVVRNRDCSTYHLDFDAHIDGELVYTTPRHREYPAGTTVRHGDVLTHAGQYQFTVSYFAGETTTATATLEPDTEPRGVLVDISGDGAVAVRTVPERTLPTAGGGDCTSTQLPYESSDPAANLADPARITWANRSGTTRTLAITVLDGDTTVLDRELTLAADSKGRTAGLIAKKGVYRTTIDPATGSTRIIEWHVDEQNPDLQLLVDPDGTLQIAAASQR
ncbi:MAG: hypothetical protein SVG88_14845 [Halobacteriales archaeon]|nr:hypothetical protein [Halobacteriales archaeon]